MGCAYNRLLCLGHLPFIKPIHATPFSGRLVPPTRNLIEQYCAASIDCQLLAVCRLRRSSASNSLGIEALVAVAADQVQARLAPDADGQRAASATRCFMRLDWFAAALAMAASSLLAPGAIAVPTGRMAFARTGAADRGDCMPGMSLHCVAGLHWPLAMCAMAGKRSYPLALCLRQ